MSGGDELLPIGQKGNYKKYIETATSSVVAEQVAGWLQASTEAIGQVGGHTAFAEAALAPTTSGAYAAGDLIGGQLTFSSVFRSTSIMTGVLESVRLIDKSTNNAQVDLILFETATTGTTYTNDAAFTVADADLSKIVAKVALVGANYVNFADNAMADVGAIGKLVRATTGTSLFGAVISRSTPTYASTGDLSIRIAVLQD